jgi:Domain of unknown function (DUF4476)
MKKLSVIVLGLFTVCQVFAQRTQRTSTVYINLFGNRNAQVAIDGTNYNLSSTTTTKATTTLSNLVPGMHSLTVTRTGNNNANNNRNNISTEFNLRRNFDMTININANGSLELIETRRGAGQTTGNTRAAMTASDFYTLSRNVRAQRTTDARYNYLVTTFNNTNTYLSSQQVTELLRQVSAESQKLALAKLSYRTVVDPNNFYLVVNTLTSAASRNDLEDYVYYFDEEGSGSGYPGSGIPGTTGTPMSDASFNSLYNTVRGQYPVTTQVNSINNAFNTNGYLFSAAQAAQLISLVSNESYRLQLAKASYKSIVDPANFYAVSSLVTSQAAKDELAAYISGQTYPGSGSGTVYRTPMSDAEYNTLYDQINSQFLPFQQMNSLTTTFNNPSYYFTTAQAKKLIQLVSSETNRLTLAKAAYRNLTDRANYTSLYDLFTTQSYRNELNAYVQAYRD